VSWELQTWSTAEAVEAVPEREVSCLSAELQTWSTAVAVDSVLESGSSCVTKDRNRGDSSLFDSADTVANGY